jgi:outer membrane protein assembly factor BamD
MDLVHARRFKNPMWALIIACLVALVGACASTPEDQSGLSAAELYASAQQSVRNGNWEVAIKSLRRVQARFPFDPYALQAHLDLINVHLQQRDAEQVVMEADRFIKENPRHPRVDYAYYMRGLAYFPPEPWFMNNWFDIDQADFDVTPAAKSFQYFRRLVEAYPNSEFVPDARARMVFLQNMLARHELHVAKWYMRRGAYLAAAQRATDLLRDFPECDSQAETLELMVLAYRNLGLTQLADDAQKVLDLNFPGHKNSLRFQPRNERWFDWLKAIFS